MRRDAESHADEDRKQVELAEARNRAENTIHSLEKAIKDQGDKLAVSDREPLEAAISKLREALKQNEAEAIKLATAELEQTANAFRSAFASSPQTETETPDPKGSNDDAIDAEFEVKN